MTSLAAALLAVFVSGSALASTIRVPDDEPTIASALGTVAAGDTVLVAAGTYAENVVLPIGVTLRGEDPPGSVSLAAVIQGPCVTVRGGDLLTRLVGLRLTGGRGESDGQSSTGGDLLIDGGLLSVTECWFEDGQATFGGGSAAIGAQVTFQSCTWNRTQARFGGAHFQTGGSAHFEDCWFDAPSADRGGALFVSQATLSLNGLRCSEATATGNGGGVYLEGTVATISASTFESNRAGGRGSALAVGAGGQVLASFLKLIRNDAALGGAFHVSCQPSAVAPPTGSTAPRVDRTDGASIADCALLAMTHVDIVANTGGAPAAGSVTDEGVVRIVSSIVAGNASGLACLDPRATLEVRCSDLYANGGVDVSGPCLFGSEPSNLSVDPHFCGFANGDLGLCSNSPLLAPGCGDTYWGTEGERCGPCQPPTPTFRETWGLLKFRYR